MEVHRATYLGSRNRSDPTKLFCSGDNCSCDDISDNKAFRVRVMIVFLVRGRVRIKVRIRVRVGVTFNVRVYRRSNCRRNKCRTFEIGSV